MLKIFWLSQVTSKRVTKWMLITFILLYYRHNIQELLKLNHLERMFGLQKSVMYCIHLTRLQFVPWLVLIYFSVTHCPFPPNIKNGFISASSGVVYGANVTYKCNNGFSMDGNSVIECMDNGKWRKVPVCQSNTSSFRIYFYNLIAEENTLSDWIKKLPFNF